MEKESEFILQFFPVFSPSKCLWNRPTLSQFTYYFLIPILFSDSHVFIKKGMIKILQSILSSFGIPVGVYDSSMLMSIKKGQMK